MCVGEKGKQSRSVQSAMKTKRKSYQNDLVALFAFFTIWKKYSGFLG